ncbi:hypothetical protein ACFL2T_05970 [Elusimicrobiota bacterium]
MFGKHARILMAASLTLGLSACASGSSEEVAKGAMQLLSKELSKGGRYSIAQAKLYKQMGIFYYFHLVAMPGGGGGPVHCDVQIQAGSRRSEVLIYRWGGNPGSKCADLTGPYRVDARSGTVTRKIPPMGR